jgi:hypothetical protein
LKAVKVSKLLASATDIPFADNSFDLAFSSEMLEHLSSPDLEKAAREMVRVARKYLLISVPNREQLGKSMVKCKVCAEVYHAYGHLHSFTDSSLRGLFPGTQKLDSLCFGPTSKDYHPVAAGQKSPWGPILPSCRTSVVSPLRKRNLCVWI